MRVLIYARTGHMHHLKQLCEDLEVSSVLEETEDGFSIFPIGEELAIKVKALDPGVCFYSPIASCPELKKEEFFIQVMKANLFGQGTAGAAIGLEPELNLLTLSSTLAYDMVYRSFRESLEDFANIVSFWREEIDLHNERAKSSIL